MLKQISAFGMSLLILLSCYGVASAKSRKKETKEYFNDPDVVELIFAAAKGNIRKIDALVAQGVNVNALGKDTMTPLLWSLRWKNLSGYKRLLERGANPNIHAEGRYSVIGLMASGDAPEFLKLALEHGGNPNLLDPYSKDPPIFSAIISLRKENFKLLIKAGANLNFQDGSGRTPLIVAAGHMQYDMVYELLVAGADFRIKNIVGRTLAWEIENDNIDPKSEGYKWRAKVIEFLRARDVEVNPRIP